VAAGRRPSRARGGQPPPRPRRRPLPHPIKLH